MSTFSLEDSGPGGIRLAWGQGAKQEQGVPKQCSGYSITLPRTRYILVVCALIIVADLCVYVYTCNF